MVTHTNNQTEIVALKTQSLYASFLTFFKGEYIIYLV
jgi:hypothetical protein